MILSDTDVKLAIAHGRLRITPFEATCLQPASYDVHLGERFLWFPPGAIDPATFDAALMVETRQTTPFWLPASSVVLYELAEHLTLPDDIVARVEGKSSLARLGLTVHLTAGYVDPGWDGVLTLELKNEHADRGIRLRPGMKIAQLSFMRLSSPAERLYGSAGLGSHYQGSVTVVGSRYA